MKYGKKRFFLDSVIFLVIVSCVTVGSYYQIYELYSVAAILLGWILATFSINLYQSKNLERELRDLMLKEYEITFNSAGKAMMSWTMWMSNPNSEERFFNTTSSIWELNAKSQTFANRLINLFKLSTEDRSIVEALTELCDHWTETINDSLVNRNTSKDMLEKLQKISKKFQRNFQLTLFIILISEI